MELPSNNTQNGLFKRDQAFKDALTKNEERVTQIKEVIQQFEDQKILLNKLPESLKTSILVPIGKKGFFRGHLVHTNEVYHNVGAKYVIKKTSKQAIESCDRLINESKEFLKRLEDEEKWLEDQLNYALKSEAFQDGVEIIEEFDEEEELLWREKHRENVRIQKQKEKNERETNQNNNDKDLFELLDNLELKEEISCSNNLSDEIKKDLASIGKHVNGDLDKKIEIELNYTKNNESISKEERIKQIKLELEKIKNNKCKIINDNSLFERLDDLEREEELIDELEILENFDEENNDDDLENNLEINNDLVKNDDVKENNGISEKDLDVKFGNNGEIIYNDKLICNNVLSNNNGIVLNENLENQIFVENNSYEINDDNNQTIKNNDKLETNYNKIETENFQNENFNNKITNLVTESNNFNQNLENIEVTLNKTENEQKDVSTDDLVRNNNVIENKFEEIQDFIAKDDTLDSKEILKNDEIQDDIQIIDDKLKMYNNLNDGGKENEEEENQVDVLNNVLLNLEIQSNNFNQNLDNKELLDISKTGIDCNDKKNNKEIEKQCGEIQMVVPNNLEDGLLSNIELDTSCKDNKSVNKENICENVNLVQNNDFDVSYVQIKKRYRKKYMNLSLTDSCDDSVEKTTKIRFNEEVVTQLYDANKAPNNVEQNENKVDHVEILAENFFDAKNVLEDAPCTIIIQFSHSSIGVAFTSSSSCDIFEKPSDIYDNYAKPKSILKNKEKVTNEIRLKVDEKSSRSSEWICNDTKDNEGSSIAFTGKVKEKSNSSTSNVSCKANSKRPSRFSISRAGPISTCK